jgi:hypothetical protein
MVGPLLHKTMLQNSLSIFFSNFNIHTNAEHQFYTLFFSI